MSTQVEGLCFHHIGIATSDIDAEIATFSNLGFSRERGFEDSAMGVRGVFMVNGSFRVELLTPTQSPSPLDGWIVRGTKMYHQAFMTENFDQSVEQLRLSGSQEVYPPTKSTAFSGSRIAFFMMRNLILIEIIESNGPR